jgi:GLPGLI family protein
VFYYITNRFGGYYKTPRTLNLQALKNIFFFFLIVATYASAQLPSFTGYKVPDSVAVGKVVYQLSYGPDVYYDGMPGIATLQFNKLCSSFHHWGDSLTSQGMWIDSPYGFKTKSSELGDKYGHIVYKDHRNKVMFTREFGFIDKGRIIVSDTFGQIDWSLDTVFKKIATFECQRATGIFHGREYEAWFAAALPVPSGPYKFGGLPGLILELKLIGVDYHFSFVCKAVYLNSSSIVPIVLPIGKDSKLTYAQYIEASIEANLQAIRMAQANGGDLEISEMPGLRIESWPKLPK